MFVRDSCTAQSHSPYRLCWSRVEKGTEHEVTYVKKPAIIAGFLTGSLYLAISDDSVLAALRLCLIHRLIGIFDELGERLRF